MITKAIREDKKEADDDVHNVSKKQEGERALASIKSDSCNTTTRVHCRDKTTQIILRVSGEGKGRSSWIIPNKILCRHSEYFANLLHRNKHTNRYGAEVNANAENKIEFREIIDKTVTFEYDEGMAQVLNWIEGDGQRPIGQDIWNSFVSEDEDFGLVGDVFVSAMRAAHYLGVKVALFQLEHFISDGSLVDADNCLSLLSISDELGAERLSLTSCIVALQKLHHLKADPYQQDDSSGMMYKDAISLINASLPRPYD